MQVLVGVGKLIAGQCQGPVGMKYTRISCAGVLIRCPGMTVSLERGSLARSARTTGWTIGCLVSLLVIAGSATAERFLYRYHTESGAVVQGDRLPAGAAARGYSILNTAGDVLKVVPRQLSGEERAERDRLREQALAEEQEQERLLKWDQSLFMRYSGLEDIDDAMRRGLLKYDTRIGILRGNLQSLKSQIEREQSNAANYLRMGRQVPDSLQQLVAKLRNEVVDVEQAIVALRKERIDAELEFHNDKERFVLLLEKTAASR